MVAFHTAPAACIAAEKELGPRGVSEKSGPVVLSILSTRVVVEEEKDEDEEGGTVPVAQAT